MLDSKFFFSDFFFFSGLQDELRRELFLCVWGLSKKKKKTTHVFIASQASSVYASRSNWSSASASSGEGSSLALSRRRCDVEVKSVDVACERPLSVSSFFLRFSMAERALATRS